MPIYEYVCEKCGKLTDVWQKLSDPPPDKCEGCGAAGPLTKCMSRTSFVLKGGGWYSDLYSSTKKDSAKDSGSSSPKAESSSTTSSTGSSSSGTTTSTAPATGSSSSSS